MILRRLILISLCCFSGWLTAQDARDRVLADSLFLKEGAFMEAGAIYNRLARLWEGQGRLDSAFRHDLLQAKTLMQAQEYGDCLRLCDQLLSDQLRPHAGQYLGEVYEVKGYVELELFELEPAIASLQKAIELESQRMHPDTFDIAKTQQFLGLAYLYADEGEEAEKQLLQAYERYQIILPTDDINLGYVANSLYLFYDEMYKYEKAGYYLEEAIRILNANLPESHPHLAVLQNNLAAHLVAIGEPHKGQKILQNMVQLNEAAGRPRLSLENCTNLVDLLLRMEDLELAGLYAQKMEELGDSLYPNPSFERANVYDVLASYAYARKDYEEADTFFRLGLSQKKVAELQMGKEIARSYHSLALIGIELERWQDAIHLLEQSLEIRLEELGADHPLSLESQYRLGQAFWGMGERNKALSIWKQCLNFLQQRQEKAYHPITTMAYWLAEGYFKLGQMDSADYYLKLAWTSMLKWPDVISGWKQLEMGTIQLFQPMVFDFCHFHLQMVLDRSDLAEAEKIELTSVIVQQFSSFLPKMLPLLNSHQAKAALGEKIRNVYATAALILHQAKASVRTEDQALFLACIENSKAFTIRLALQQQTAMRFAQVPDSITERLQYLNSRTWALQSLKDQASDEVRYGLQEQELKVHTEWTSLQQEVVKRYPNYHRLMYQPPVLEMSYLTQCLIDKKQTLLAYLDLDSLFLVVEFDGESMRSHQWTPDAQWQNKLNAFNQLLEQRGNLDSILYLSAYLTEAVFQPVREHISKNLLIIPDGMLHALNFELLSISNAENSASPWFVQHFQIQYANTLSQIYAKGVQNKTRLALAPGFSSESKKRYQSSLPADLRPDSVYLNWLSTPWSLALVEEFEQENWGHTLLEGEATKDRFLQEAKEAGLIHFATHAKVNNKAPLKSYLALYPSGQHPESAYLFAHELYGIQLPTALVVLNACETGLGPYRAGEGLLSLAHAFQYAGSPSLIMSLWKIDDQQSNWLIREFYAQLDQKRSASHALNHAKRAYLETYSGELAHPYYWGSLVFMGKDQILEEKGPLAYLLGFLVLILLSAGVFYIKK